MKKLRFLPNWVLTTLFVFLATSVALYASDGSQDSASAFVAISEALQEIYSVVKILAKGVIYSIGLFVLTVLFALPCGLLVALARMSKNSILRNVARVYISIMRGTPLML